ncbi:MAG: hypothetical protein KBA51_06950 [Kiritimatiellae bacterium]|nr:hypothetical protein [Kiritimatiellia bacterium]
MSAPPVSRPEGCGASCESCSCKSAAQAAETAAGDLSGWRYAGWAALMFLFPVICAAGGAFVARRDPGLQAFGGVGGLIAGAVMARGLGRRLRPG